MNNSENWKKNFEDVIVKPVYLASTKKMLPRWWNW